MEQAKVTWDAFGNPIQVIDMLDRKRTFGYGPIRRLMVPDSARGKTASFTVAVL